MSLERTQLAQERTLLAWTRTCFTMFAAGMAMARSSHVVQGLGLRHTGAFISIAAGLALLGAAGQFVLDSRRLQAHGAIRRFPVSLGLALLSGLGSLGAGLLELTSLG